MQRQTNDSESNSLPTAIRSAAEPDARFAEAFRQFRELFRLKPDADVSNIRLLSYITGNEFVHREILGAVITGAVLAMLDHEKDRGDWAEKSLLELPAIVDSVPGKIRDRLDEIILAQGGTTGEELNASDLVWRCVLQWQRTDSRKHKRWLRALDKAARVRQGTTAAPLKDPFWRDIKQRAVEELRPVVKRLRERLSAKRKDVSEEEIVIIFAEEALDSGALFLCHPLNHELWIQFCKRDPLGFRHLSPEKLFDAFVAFSSGHNDPEYVRRMISLAK